MRQAFCLRSLCCGVNVTRHGTCWCAWLIANPRLNFTDMYTAALSSSQLFFFPLQVTMSVQVQQCSIRRLPSHSLPLHSAWPPVLQMAPCVCGTQRGGLPWLFPCFTAKQQNILQANCTVNFSPYSAVILRQLSQRGIINGCLGWLTIPLDGSWRPHGESYRF